jgi:hypothetical protein
MKIRNGFVSNSSSSSFILIGIPVDKDKIDLNELILKYMPDADLSDEDFYWKYLYKLKKHDIYVGNEDDDLDENKIYFGERIDIDDCEGLDHNEYDIKSLMDKAEKLKKQHNLDTNDIKIITGTRCC